MSSSQRSARVQTAYAVCESYSSLSPDKLSSHFAEGFHHVALPSTLGMPTRSKEDFQKHAQMIFGVFETFRMTPQEVFEDPAKNTVIVHAKMGGDLFKGLGDYENEVILIMQMTEDGSQVVKLTEFVDTATGFKLREKLSSVMGQGKGEETFTEKK